MEPQDALKPAEGALVITRWCAAASRGGKSQQQLQQDWAGPGKSSSSGAYAGVETVTGVQLQEGFSSSSGGRGGEMCEDVSREESSSSSSSLLHLTSTHARYLKQVGGCQCCGSFLYGDVVATTLLPLLVHMFEEQMPVICSTLELLKQQVHKERQQHQGFENGDGLKGESRGWWGDGGWLRLPRSLGKHCFTLYDPVSGQVAAEGERAGSAYVAWRAALLAHWYEALAAEDKEDVRDVLRQIDGAWSARAAGRGPVDAAGAFAAMLRLVRECGPIERRHNKIWVNMNGFQPLSKL
jgi:hypothetical protein